MRKSLNFPGLMSCPAVEKENVQNVPFLDEAVIKNICMQNGHTSCVFLHVYVSV